MIVHSQIIEEDNIQKVIVHFEHPTEDGFDDARCELPEYKWIKKRDILMKKSLYLSSCFKAMSICCINMRQKGEFRLPNFFTVSGYKSGLTSREFEKSAPFYHMNHNL